MPNENSGPIEIKVKLDKTEIRRDIALLKEKGEKDRARERFTSNVSNFGRPSSGFSGGGSGGGGLGFGLDKPAFPSGASSGLGTELPKSAQKAISDTIGKSVPNAVKKEIAGIDWKSLLKSFTKGGTTGVTSDLAGTAKAGIGEAIEGGALGEAGAGALGLAGGVATGLGVAALVAIAVKKGLDDLAKDAGYAAILTGILVDKFPVLDGLDKFVNEVAAKLELFKAAIDSLKPAISKTIDLESARLRLGQGITPGSVGSDFEKIRQLEQNEQRQKDKIKRDSTEESVRTMVKSLAGGAR